MAGAALVSNSAGTHMRHSPSSASVLDSVGVTQRQATPSTENRGPTISRLDVIWGQFRRKGFSEPLVKLLVASNRTSTLATYESAWKRWSYWCFQRGENPLSVSLNSVLEFLAHFYLSGKSYSPIYVNRSMLSKTLTSFNGNPVGIHPLVKNLLDYEIWITPFHF